MSKRKFSPVYIFFYLIFLPDTYRIIIGILAAWTLAPKIIATQPMSLPGKVMIWIMLATIGYAATGAIAEKITAWLKKIILKDQKKQP